MKTLSKQWITEEPLDFEYKQYVLLAYLQHIRSNFTESKLYPVLSDLIEQHRSLSHIQNARQQLNDQFRKELDGLDLKRLEFKYKSAIAEAEYDKHIEEMLSFSLPKIHACMEEGKELYDFVDRHLDLEIVGVLPMYQAEGYLLLYPEGEGEYAVYQYRLSNIERMGETFHALRFKHLYNARKTAFETFSQVKRQLVKSFKDLPNPATFLARAKMHFPMTETLLPVAKRQLIGALRA